MTDTTQEELGAVYTPRWVVDLMLGEVGSWAGLDVLDPGCGDGEFLGAVVERTLDEMENGGDREACMATLRGLTGFDLDRDALDKARKRLDALMEARGMEPMDWRLLYLDALDKTAWTGSGQGDLLSDPVGGLGQFDLVVGNPPYVRVQHLGDDARRRMQNGNWRLVTGASDLFYVFFEGALEVLRPGGRVIFITSSSWMRSLAGSKLRDELRTAHTLDRIIDFGDAQVFPDATVYVCVTDIIKGVPGGETRAFRVEVDG